VLLALVAHKTRIDGSLDGMCDVDCGSGSDRLEWIGASDADFHASRCKVGIAPRMLL
jgi:hypothetical protein